MTLSTYDYETNYFVFNAYTYTDEETDEVRVVLEGLPQGKSARYPKKINLSLKDCEKSLGYKGEILEDFIAGLKTSILTIRSDVEENVMGIKKQK